ncbi:hypothetical protein ACFWIX_05980 [Pseudarthrobacter sp. NPDC058362]|uniref:hypothetical protein n=1 Tax=unclassified Pseudarthrobacter TaxID=2647000 RepID=UPI003659B830
MTFAKSLGFGAALSLLTLAAVFLITFVTNGDFSLPAFVVVESTTTATGAPETSMFFNPLGPVLLALLAGALIWLVSRGMKRQASQQ